MQLEHFHPDERPFVRRVVDWITMAERRHQPFLSPFLDPREQSIVQIIGSGVTIKKDGGYPKAERCRVQIIPTAYHDELADWGMSFLRIQHRRQEPMRHRDVLGSLIGLGIKREILGDLLPHSDGCDVILLTEYQSYIAGQLEKVGSQPVMIEEIGSDELMREEQRITHQISVSSLRLDTLLSTAFRISRKEAVKKIRNGQCKQNWRVVEHAHKLVDIGDWVSLRGYGRFYVQSLKGTSKKGKRWVDIEFIS